MFKPSLIVREILVGHPLDDSSITERLFTYNNSEMRKLPLGTLYGDLPSSLREEIPSTANFLNYNVTDDGLSIQFSYKELDSSRNIKKQLILIDNQQIASNIYGREYFENCFVRSQDPWQYNNSGYEALKYQQTLDALPNLEFNNALELACAEGHFTEMLASKVKKLHAVDISAVALSRAKKRCVKSSNTVSFEQLDFFFR